MCWKCAHLDVDIYGSLQGFKQIFASFISSAVRNGNRSLKMIVSVLKMLQTAVLLFSAALFSFSLII